MKYDIIIIGAGPAGLSFARSLADTGLKILVVEKCPLEGIREPAIDGRDIALTHLSLKLLKGLGAWQRISGEGICPIREARVLDGDSPYILNFENHKAGVEALGYLVPNFMIRKAMYEVVEPLDNVEILTGTSVADVQTGKHNGIVALSNGETREAALIVAADSRFSETRRKMGISADMHDFGRVAIVCRMQHELPHYKTAYECFHYGRTLAILPMYGNESSTVVTVNASQANEIMNMREAEFSADVEQRFDQRLGKMSLAGERFPYPLVAVHANRFAARRFAVIGDAAVGMHPVTAHGFNLGLRGQDTLAREIRNALSQGKDIGSWPVLGAYQSKHMRVTRPLYHGTNGIVSLFTNETSTAKLLRKLVIHASNHLPPIKHLVTNQLTEKDENKLGLLPWPPLPFLR